MANLTMCSFADVGIRLRNHLAHLSLTEIDISGELILSILHIKVIIGVV